MGIFSKKKTNTESKALYDEGMSYIGKDDSKAFEILYKSAKMENELAEFQIGMMLETGTGTAKDRTESAEWYSDSIDDGCEMAKLYLARLYIQGLDPEFDEEEATGLLSSLIESDIIGKMTDSTDIISEIAEMLISGKGSFENLSLGLELKRTCDEMGNTVRE